MPFYFNELDITAKVSGCESVLLVPCRFCPAASSAVKHNKPYIEIFRRLLKTEPYEQLIRKIQSDLQASGVKTSVFKSKILHQFVLCMWTSGRRKKLRERAKGHDAVVVLGCEGATQTVRDSLKSTECRVVQGMETEGLMSIIPKFRLPGTLSLELNSLTRVLLQDEEKGVGARS
jgi:hypothetical protein